MEDNIELLEAVEQMLARFDIHVSLTTMTVDERDAWLAQQSERTQRIVESIVEMPETEALSNFGGQSPGSLGLDALAMLPAFRLFGWGGRAAKAVGRPAVKLGKNAFSRLNTAMRNRVPAASNIRPDVKGATFKPARTIFNRSPKAGWSTPRGRGGGWRGAGTQLAADTLGLGAGVFAARMLPIYPDREDPAPATREYTTTETEVDEDGEPISIEVLESSLKNFYWDGQSTEQVGDKFVNFLLGKGLPLKIGNQYESMLDYLATDQRAKGVEIHALHEGDNMQLFQDLIRENAYELPEFQNWLGARVRKHLVDKRVSSEEGAAAGWATGILRGNITASSPASEEDMRLISGVLGSSAAAAILNQEDAASFFGGFVDDAIAEYAQEYAKGNPYMVSYGDEDDKEYALPAFNEPTRLSYDGTPFGTVNSLEDLFSGVDDRFFGHLDIPRFLEDLQLRTEENGVSSYIAQLQQTLYSMSYLHRDGREWTPVTWGVVDEETIRGLQNLRMDLVENASEARFNGIEPDMHLLYRELANASIRGFHSDPPTTTAGLEENFRNQILQEARDGITDALRARGLTEKDSTLYDDAVAEVFDGMTGAEREAVSGQGGTTEDAAGVSRILQEFYGAGDDWADHIEFGHVTNNDSMFLNYAQRTGAISEQELDDLTSYSYNPDHMARVRARHGKDIAVSHFLSSLDGNSIAEASEDQIRNALVRYANTMGQGYAGRRGFSPQALFDIADRAYADLPTGQPAGIEQLLDTQEGRIEAAMRINEHGVDNPMMTRLLSSLSASSGVRTERARS